MTIKPQCLPKVEDKILEEIYDPVIKCFSNPEWTEVNKYLSESFGEYRKNTPEGYGTCVTKTVILAYLLLQDPQKANTVVEEILYEIWEGNNFDSLDASELYNRAREVCNS